MKKIIKNTVLFFVGLGLLNALVYGGVYFYNNHLFFKSDAVFVWGDSQTYEGIDLAKLSANLEKKVYSTATYGAGVYDFLRFTDQVSENAEVIVSVAKLVQVRRKKYDFHRTGLSAKSLSTMYQNNYSLSEIISIIKKNLKPDQYIRSKIKLSPYQDNIEPDLPLSHFQDYYQEIPSFLEDKQSIYLQGIKNLIAKDCKITFIEFPYHPALTRIESQSPILPKTETFKENIAALFPAFQTDTIFLQNDKNIFKDYSHLNMLGANQLSTMLAEKMKKNNMTILYIVRP